MTILTNELTVLIGNSRNSGTVWQNNRQFTASNRLALLINDSAIHRCFITRVKFRILRINRLHSCRGTITNRGWLRLRNGNRRTCQWIAIGGSTIEELHIAALISNKRDRRTVLLADNLTLIVCDARNTSSIRQNHGNVTTSHWVTVLILHLARNGDSVALGGVLRRNRDGRVLSRWDRNRIDRNGDNWLGRRSGIATVVNLHSTILITNSEVDRLTILTNDLAILISNSRNSGTVRQNNRELAASNRLAILINNGAIHSSLITRVQVLGVRVRWILLIAWFHLEVRATANHWVVNGQGSRLQRLASSVSTVEQLHLTTLLGSESDRLAILVDNITIVISLDRNLSAVWQNNRELVASNRLAVLIIDLTIHSNRITLSHWRWVCAEGGLLRRWLRLGEVHRGWAVLELSVTRRNSDRIVTWLGGSHWNSEHAWLAFNWGEVANSRVAAAVGSVDLELLESILLGLRVGNGVVILILQGDCHCLRISDLLITAAHGNFRSSWVERTSSSGRRFLSCYTVVTLLGVILRWVHANRAISASLGWRKWIEVSNTVLIDYSTHWVLNTWNSDVHFSA